MSLALTTGSVQLFAATKTFRGTLDNGSFSRGANWVPNGVPQDGDDLILDPLTLNNGQPVISSVVTNDITSPLRVRNLTLIGARLFGRPLTVTGKIEGYQNVPEIHADLTLTGDREIRADAGRLVIYGAVSMVGDTRLVVGGPRTATSGQLIDGTLELRGAIRGTGNILCLQDSGSAEGILFTGTQANTYTGTFVVDGPAVVVTRTVGRMFDGVVEVRNGRLGVATDDAALVGATIKALAGTTVMVTNGAVPALHLVDSFADVRSGIGEVTLEGAELFMRGTVGNIWVPGPGGISVIRGVLTARGAPLALRVDSGSVLSVLANMTVTNASPATVKEGGGVLEVTGTNRLGSIEIQSGRLRVQSTTALNPSPAPVAVRSGGTLQIPLALSDTRLFKFNNVDLTLYDGARFECANVEWDGDVQAFGTPVIVAARAIEWSRAVRGPGGLSVENGVSGVLRVNGSGAATLSGTVHLRSGGMELGRSNALGNARWVLESNVWMRIDAGPQTVPGIDMRGGQIYSSSALIALQGPLTASGVSTDSLIDSRLEFGGAGMISNAAALRLRGAISSAAGLRKVGGGDLTLASGTTQTEVSGWLFDEGRVIAEDGDCFGRGAVSVSVAGGAILRCDSPLGSPIVYSSTIAKLMGGAVLEGGNCLWQGTIELLGTATMRPDPTLSLLGPVTGPGGFVVEGSADGELDLRSSSTYQGVTHVANGRLRMGRAGVVPGRLIVGQLGSGGVALARWAAEDAVNPLAEISVLPGGLADLDGYDQSVAQLSIQQGEVRTGTGELTLKGDLSVPGGFSAGSGLLRGQLRLTPGQHFVNVAGPADNGLICGALVTGAGGLTKIGAGWLRLTGAAPNEYSGSTWVQAGMLALGKSNFVEAIAGTPLVVESNALVRWEANGQLAPETSVVGSLGATFDLGAFPLLKPEVFGSLEGNGLLQVGSNVVQVGANHRSTTFAGIFGGRGAVAKTGSGVWTLTGRNPYPGLVRSVSGLVQVDGALLAAGFVATNSGGLSGTGFVQTVTVASNATLKPGASPGILTIGDLTLRPGSRLVMELNGNGPGTGFDQVEVSGSAIVTDAVAELHIGFVPALAKTFRLINVTSSNPLIGTFRGWGQGGTNVADGLTFRADYLAGTGNDFVAEVISLGTAAPNQPPVFPPPAAAIVAEGEELTRVFSATAPEPNQAVTFSFASAPPGGASIDAVTGAFSWTPREARGPSTNVLLMVASDNGQPALSVTQAWTVVVTEVNAAPTLAALAPISVNEGETIDRQIEADDPDRPPQKLEHFLLDAVPNGLTLDPNSGRLRWTPSESQGPSTVAFRVKVSDSGSPRLSVTSVVQVVVREQNEPPVLASLEDQRVVVGNTLRFTVQATDPDRPLNSLLYLVGANAPTQASLNPQTGVFRWTPIDADVGTHVVRFEVNDQGTPPKSDRQTVRIEVVPATPAVLEATLLASGLLELSWSTDLSAYQLVRSVQLVSSNWVAVPEVPSVLGDRYRVEVTPSGAQRFFRLQAVTAP